VHERYSKILKTIISKIQKQKIDYVFTIEDDFVSLLSVSILGIPGAHFFHSLPYVKAFIHNTLYIKFLQKRSIFAVSKFIQIKVKYLLGVNAAIWCPIINFSKYRISSKEINSNVIGFYSGGRHKGDEIINKIIEKMPRCNFIVIGRNYQNQFKEIPGNLKYLGDLIDIKTFYEQIKLLLVPSVIEEAFPRVILETAINGIPVIANNVGGITEALGNSGISIDIDTTNKLNIDEIADKYIFEINRLLNNDLEYTIYSKKALMRAKEYQIEQEKMSRYIYEKFIKTAPENPVLWTGMKGASAKGRKNVI
jgi:glycosyltransferase involved in cell wall biosynthesis